VIAVAAVEFVVVVVPLLLRVCVVPCVSVDCFCVLLPLELVVKVEVCVWPVKTVLFVFAVRLVCVVLFEVAVLPLLPPIVPEVTLLSVTVAVLTEETVPTTPVLPVELVVDVV